ncbi:MAG: helix-turn-helix transcriptional regulator [Bacteroidetes bacterium]|nr:helix-turn-helix transcriptional regulator [Bacteroidota bacterium]
MKFENTFGETVKKLRERNNLTLREVASALQIDTSTLGKIEKNSRKPTIELIEKFSGYFKADIEELKIAFLSDTVAYRIFNEDDNAKKILKLAEKKVRYLKENNLKQK